MNKKEMANALRPLEIGKGKRYDGDQLRYIYDRIQGEDVKYLILCANSFEVTEKFLPNADVLVKAVRQEASADRDTQQRKRHSQARKEPAFFNREQSDKMAKQSSVLIRALLSGLIDNEKFHEGVRVLDKEFPSAGWASAGQRLKNWQEWREAVDADPDGPMRGKCPVLFTS